jgi:chemotaxis protein methyltransferase CheR
MQISDNNYSRLIQLIYEKSGIVLTKEKSYLVEARLTPLLSKYSLESFDALTAASYRDQQVVKDVIEAITTNESSFFRDLKPFDYLKNQLIPALKKQTPKASYKIWSAACASGQEPYSICMSLLEAKETHATAFEILATDIDSNIVKVAKEGVYTQFEVQRGVPIPLLMQYFTQRNEEWVIKEDLKKHIQFKIFNLLNDGGALGQFDIIFCRNVLIYFDKETKQNILENMCKRMHSHSVLFLGSTETLLGINVPLKQVKDVGCPGIYMLA